MFSDQDSEPRKTVVLLGAGSIGTALLQQLLNDITASQKINCIATWHKHLPAWQHKNLEWYKLDATNPIAMQEFAQHLQRQSNGIDWVINCIGFLHEVSSSNAENATLKTSASPEKRIADYDQQYFMRCMAVNVNTTLLAAQYLSPLFHKKRPTIFAAISAKVGSIEDNRLGGWYSYRASKAALNMVLKTLSLEWRRVLPLCCVVAFHPGTTASPLSQPFSASVPANKLFTPQYSANCMFSLLMSMTPENTGQFWSWDGSRIPW